MRPADRGTHPAAFHWKGAALTGFYFTLLNQDRQWVDGRGHAVPVDHLPADDAYVAGCWLRDNAVALARHIHHELRHLPAQPLPHWIPVPHALTDGASQAWVEATPLAKKLSAHASVHFTRIDGKLVRFHTISVDGIRRWRFSGCNVARGYATWQDAAVEAELQLAGKVRGPLAAARGHIVDQAVHRANVRQQLAALRTKGSKAEAVVFSFDLLPDNVPLPDDLLPPVTGEHPAAGDGADLTQQLRQQAEASLRVAQQANEHARELRGRLDRAVQLVGQYTKQARGTTRQRWINVRRALAAELAELPTAVLDEEGLICPACWQRNRFVGTRRRVPHHPPHVRKPNAADCRLRRRGFRDRAHRLRRLRDRRRAA
ncbi:hypothetical protein [Nonomuraea sp. NPDC049400]|uniref:hypothetical protein n=1 Tax=Nonomuraea sp. NPDC049400 TaxID=3364352 RepID=UPI00378D9DCA